MVNQLESYVVTGVTLFAGVASFLFDEPLGVIVACAAGSYFAAYKSKAGGFMDYLLIIFCGIFLGVHGVKGLDYILTLNNITPPPRQFAGIVISFTIIHEPTREGVGNWFGKRFKAIGEALDKRIRGEK